jgi:hypothetical protein
MQKKDTITGDIVEAKAAELWEHLLQFDGMDQLR